MPGYLLVLRISMPRKTVKLQMVTFYVKRQLQYHYASFGLSKIKICEAEWLSPQSWGQKQLSFPS